MLHPLVYIIPILCAIAIINNGVIIAVSIASKRFSKELFPSVRLLYGMLALLDILCVISYQLIEWIGKWLTKNSIQIVLVYILN